LARGRDVPVSALQLGQVLGDGGQGTVYRVTNHPGLVFKKYKLSGVNAAALANLIALPQRLPTDDANLLYAHTAWPFARVTHGASVHGVLMPEVPRRFVGTTVAGPKLQEVQYLLYPPKPMWGDIKPLDVTGRFFLVLRFACLVRMLHRHGVVLGDISMSNVLWSAENNVDVYVIDCDGARIGADPAPLPQTNTPDWEDPLCPPTQADQDSDAYKLALFAGRVMARDAQVRPGEPLNLIGGMGDRRLATLVDMFQRAGCPRHQRPTASEWCTSLVLGREMIPMPARPSAPPSTSPKLPLAPLTDTTAPRASIPMPSVPRHSPPSSH
jgi:hypothetical protein